jgi:hypothetical protein
VREPASLLLVTLCDELLDRQLQSVRLPFTGIYRWEVTLSGQAARIVVAQTGAHPERVVHPATTDQRELYCVDRVAAEHSLPFVVARSESDLTHGSSARRGTIIVTQGRHGPDGTATWPAELDPMVFEQLFRDSPAFHQFRIDWTRYEARALEGVRIPPSGAFRQLATGRVLFDQVLRLPDGRTLQVHGERLSAFD